MSLNKFLKNRIWAALWQIFTKLFIYLGLPLLAWGPGDLAGFLANPARAGLVVVLAAHALILAWLVYRSLPHGVHEHRFDLANWHSLAFELLIILVAYGDRRGILSWGENLPLRWAGLGIYLAGMLYSTWGNLTWIQHLLREGSHAVDDPVLLKEGPFRWIRYPSLLALAVYGMGYVLLFRSWVGLVLMIALAGGIVHRSKEQDFVYAERYPEDWPERSSSTKKVLPYIF